LDDAHVVDRPLGVDLSKRAKPLSKLTASAVLSDYFQRSSGDTDNQPMSVFLVRALVLETMRKDVQASTGTNAFEQNAPATTVLNPFGAYFEQRLGALGRQVRRRITPAAPNDRE
jgi:hypothetical protein